MKERCPNMNHSRTNVAIRYCPSCGEVVGHAIPNRTRCDDSKHAHRRKDRNVYCCDCGTKLRE